MIRISERIYIISVLLLLFLYCRYSYPLNRLIDSGKWWRGFVISIIEENDVPSMTQYGQIDLSNKKNETGIYTDKIISSLEKDTTIIIKASVDSYPNGFMEMPFKNNKVIYSRKSTMIPMYWCAPCPAWIEITWPQNKVIEHIEVTPYCDEYGMGEYTLLVWNQQINSYIPVSSYSGRAGKFKAFDYSSITTSRIKLLVNKGGYANSFAYLKDMKIYGTPAK